MSRGVDRGTIFQKDAALTVQVTKLLAALREGTPNRRRIALQMVKDMLDESTFDASPASAVPGPVGRAAAKVAGRFKDGHPSSS